MNPSNHLSPLGASFGDYAMKGARVTHRGSWRALGFSSALVITQYHGQLRKIVESPSVPFNFPDCLSKLKETGKQTLAPVPIFPFNFFYALAPPGLVLPAQIIAPPFLVALSTGHEPSNMVCRFVNYVSGGSRTARFFHRKADR